MSPRLITAVVGTAVVAAAVTTVVLSTGGVSNPIAAAEPCPDVDVVFARGTGEPPGLGGTGQAFVDALRGLTGGKSLRVYPVNYPATNDFANSLAAGVADASGHVQSTVDDCPNTKIVLGGFSQGAAVIDSITDSMPPDVVDHVAAVAVFGNPRSAYAANLAGFPLPAISPQYAPKTTDLCVQDDAICSEGQNPFAHDLYAFTGLTTKAAEFVAGRL